MAIYYINESGFILNNIESFRSFVTAFSQFEEVKKHTVKRGIREDDSI